MNGTDGMGNAPHLRSVAGLTQLVVDNRPFLVLAGELGNSTASSAEALSEVWPTLRALGLNTVLVPVYWELIEPREGEFDFSSVDQLIHQARQHDQRLILLWFGVYKNSMSTYVPAWVKQDCKRFPRAQDRNGEPVEILSALATETLKADIAAYTSCLRHLREIDSNHHTVLMVQIENEIGFLPDAREHGPLADVAYREQVPEPLLKLTGRAAGSWEDVFGAGDSAAEIFMAWHYARFVEALAKAGKENYPLPTFVNAALNRPGRKPGQYPSGGPLPHLFEIWKAAAPSLDLLCPDVYFFNFDEWTQRYVRPGNPLFIPEAMRSGRAPANALYAIGQLRAIGFSPFGIEGIAEPASDRLGYVYTALAHLAPFITNPHAIMAGVSPKLDYDAVIDASPQTIPLGDYTLHIAFEGLRSGDTGQATDTGDPTRRGENLPPHGGLIVMTSPDDYIVVGTGLRITHAHHSGDKVGLLEVREWIRKGMDWIPHRWMNGDQTNQGRDVCLYPPEISMQKVRLYRYR